MGSLHLPLLVLGYGLGLLVYVGVALWAVRSVRSAWEWVLHAYWERRTVAEVADDDRRVAQMHRIGPAERDARRAA